MEMESFLLTSSDKEFERCLSCVSGRARAKTVAGAGTPKVVVAIPAYNEEVAIGSLVLRTIKYADEVIVVDDGSTDHTAEVARLAGARVIVHAKNEGKGAGIRDTFAYANDHGVDVIVFMDGDGQHDPDEIPLLIRPILDSDTDMVNGSRFLTKNGNNAPGYRRVGQSILNMATNAGTRQKITDTQSGFRAFSRTTFNCFSFRQKGMAIESEMLMDATDAKMRIMEVPIHVRYDVDGSTYNPITHGVDVLNRVIRLVSQRRPMLFYCIPGAVMVGIGTACAFMLVSIFDITRSLTIGFGIGAMLFVFLGMLFVSTGLTLSSIQSINQKSRTKGDIR